MQSFRELAARVPRTGFLALSFAGYLLLTLLAPLPPNYQLQPVADIRTFLPSLGGGLLYAALILILYALYALTLLSLAQENSWSLWRLLAVAALLAAPVVFMYPINANDLFRYAIRGVIQSRLGENPYAFAPVDSGDPLLTSLAGEWRNATSPYGPLWELTASALTSVAQNNLLPGMLLFKLLGLFSLLAAAVILYRLFVRRAGAEGTETARPLLFAAIWALNPALLLTFAGNGHNDALMILFLLFGWSVIDGGHGGPGFLIMLAAALIKPIALLALPIVFVAEWRRLADGGRRARFLLWVIPGAALMTWLAFLPFGAPETLLLRLVREASAGAAFSPSTLLILVAQKLGWSGSYRPIASFAAAAFAMFYIWLIGRTWKREGPEVNLALAFWGYLVQALNFRIWYATWPFPWLIINGFSGKRRGLYGLHVGLWFLLTTQLSVVLYGHIRAMALGGDHFLAHLVGVPFVFVLPFMLARWSLGLTLEEFSAPLAGSSE